MASAPRGPWAPPRARRARSGGLRALFVHAAAARERTRFASVALAWRAATRAQRAMAAIRTEARRNQASPRPSARPLPPPAPLPLAPPATSDAARGHPPLQMFDRVEWARFARRAAAFVRWRRVGTAHFVAQRLGAYARGHWRGAAITTVLQHWAAHCASRDALVRRRGAAAVALRRWKLRRALRRFRTKRQLLAARAARAMAAISMPRAAALRRWRGHARRDKGQLSLRLALRSAEAVRRTRDQPRRAPSARPLSRLWRHAQAAWSSVAGRALRALRLHAVCCVAFADATRAGRAAMRAKGFARWRGAARFAAAAAAIIGAGDGAAGRRRRSMLRRALEALGGGAGAGRRQRLGRVRAARLAVVLGRIRPHVLLQALTRWYFAAALCAAAEHRAACEVRLQGLQQAVAAFAQKLQGLDVLRQGGRGAAPAARSMVDKMTAIIAVWEASRLTHAFSIWSRCLS